jgi:selenocysteine lyase/cysteine desulfurase
MDWKAIHDTFPVNQHLVWLNNCGTTPANSRVLAAMEAFLRAYAERGVLTTAKTGHGVNAAIREKLARLLGATVDELALIHHTNEGMMFVSHGLSLASGDRIALLENEYPSNVYPWEHWRERGVGIDFVPVGGCPDEFLDGFTKTLAPSTKVVSLSAVHWCTGMPLPLAEVGRVCDERGIHFVVDASQGAGLVPIDVKAMRIGFMAFSAWKWLLGPLGLGVLYIAKDKLDGLRFPFKGSGSVVDDGRYLPYRDALKPTTERYVCSTPNFNDWVYFEATLNLLDEIGFDVAQKRIHELTRHLADRLRDAGFVLASDRFASLPTGILIAEKQGVPTAALVAALRAGHVFAVERMGRLRLAPHVYILEEQLDRCAAILAKVR